MTSASFRGALFFLLLAPSSGLKTETIVEMRNDIMMESAAPASPKSISDKVKENFDALEVAIAVQMATQQRLAGLLQGSALLVVLAALGLYAIKNQNGKKDHKDCTDCMAHADIKSSPAPASTEVPSPSPAEIEEELDRLLECQQANEDSCEDSSFLRQELNKMLDSSLEAEAEVVCMSRSIKEESPSASRADIETREMIEHELDRYLDRQHENRDLDADLSNLKTELNRMLDSSLDLHGLNKMLEDSLEAEAQAAMLIRNDEEEVDVSRIDKEIAAQFSEALGFSQVPAWME